MIDTRTLKKINQLALSLKQNRLASDMEEAVQMAKNMLVKDPAGNAKAAEMLNEMKDDLNQDKKELKDMSSDSGALGIGAELAKKRYDQDKKLEESHEKQFEHLQQDVKDTKEEVAALRDMKEDVPVVLAKEKEAYASEKQANKDLPGEQHYRKTGDVGEEEEETEEAEETSEEGTETSGEETKEEAKPEEKPAEEKKEPAAEEKKEVPAEEKKEEVPAEEKPSE